MTPYREVWRLAWPLILSNLMVPLLGITDTVVVGHLPEPHYLGAVAIGAVTFNVLYFAFVFLRMGTTGLTAQAFGRGDGDELRALLARALLLVAAIATVLLLAAAWLIDLAVVVFEPGVRVLGELDHYLAVRFLGLPAGLANQVLVGWLLGLQSARGPMLLLVVTNGINIALDVLFVLGLGWNVAGVAAATVVAEYLGLALGLWLVRRALLALPGRFRRDAILRRAAFVHLLAVNGDIFVRSLALQAALSAFTALGARQGEVILAANAVLLNLQTLAAFGLDGFAHAASAMAGRQVGAGDRAAFRAAIRANLHCALLLAGLVCLGYLLGGTSAIRGMTGLAEVRAAAATYLPYLVVSPLISVWAFLFDGVFIGATRTAEMRNGMLLALAVFALAAGLLVPALANHGLWLAFLLFMAWRGLWLGLIYLRVETRGPGFVARGLPAAARTAR